MAWNEVEHSRTQWLQLKNTENDYFNQLLGCAAPKRWLKYTTNNSNYFVFIPVAKFSAPKKFVEGLADWNMLNFQLLSK